MQYPYGNWPSPLTAENLAQGTKKFGDCQSDQDCLYWTESRPDEKGRMTIMKWSEEVGSQELLSIPYSARSKVHEYGGGSLLAAEGRVFFVNDLDQDIYEILPTRNKRITESSEWRFSDLEFDPARDRIVAVGEYHETGQQHPDNAIVSVRLDHPFPIKTPDLVVRGADFFSNPRVSPDSSKLVFLSWNLPNMPWDSARAYVKVLASDEAPEALTSETDRAFQPFWLNTTQISLVIERAESGKGKLFVLDTETKNQQALELSGDIDLDLFLPLWQFGMKSYAIDRKGMACVAGFDEGSFRLHYTDDNAVVSAVIPGIIDRICELGGLPAGIMSFIDIPPAIARVKIDDGKLKRQIIASSAGELLERNSVSSPQLINFPAGRMMGHALYYPPTLAGVEIDPSVAPPLIVSAHGGPTGFANRGFDGKIQFFTSRGFAYLDVDYRGSAGYGRGYREALDGHWGINDVEDVINAAKTAAEKGLANPDQLFISGGSAGGYTVLAALTQSSIFKAGVSRYGIGDLQLLEDTTHKFESGYLERLVGLTSTMNRAERESHYKSRSPLALAHQVTSPILFLQGLEDKVVPPSQAETMIKALRDRNIPAAYRAFEGEGHGFRQPHNITEALKLEHSFYANALGIDLGANKVAIPWVA